MPTRVNDHSPRVRDSNGKEPPRCRLRLVCDGSGKPLALRSVRRNGVVMPVLCCPPCAEADQSGAQAGGPAAVYERGRWRRR